jgi:hypothetical protein
MDISNRYLPAPWQMNLELTTKCPLHCPQCYVYLNNGREMPLETALYWIRDAAEAGVQHVNLVRRRNYVLSASYRIDT